MALTLTRVCHSSVLLDFGGHRLLTDPWFSERPGYLRGEPLAFTPATLPHLAGVLVSHGHYDHFDVDAFATYRDKQVPMLVKRGIGEAARAAGFGNVTELDFWEVAQIGETRVTATPAEHGVPENTYIIERGGTTVFFGADTLRIRELDEVAVRFPWIDLALLPINGLMIRPQHDLRVVMNAEQAAELCSVLRPRVAVPIHYTFTAGPEGDRNLLRYDGTPERFVTAMRSEAPATRVAVLAPGEPLAMPDVS
jgi:L-ascorbate metabolism protein UlaG (beta-lactamase superfamily)